MPPVCPLLCQCIQYCSRSLGSHCSKHSQVVLANCQACTETIYDVHVPATSSSVAAKVPSPSPHICCNAQCTAQLPSGCQSSHHYPYVHVAAELHAARTGLTFQQQPRAQAARQRRLETPPDNLKDFTVQGVLKSEFGALLISLGGPPK